MLEGYESCFFASLFKKPLLPILDVYPGLKNCSTGSFLTQKTCLYDIEEKKLIYDVHSGPQIRIFFSFRIPDQGVKKLRIQDQDPVGPKKGDPTDQAPEHL
jgi:hypothetical protein